MDNVQLPDAFSSVEEVFECLNSGNDDVVLGACRVWTNQLRKEAKMKRPKHTILRQYFDASPKAAEICHLVDVVVSMTFEPISVVLELCHEMLRAGLRQASVRYGVVGISQYILGNRIKILYQLLSADDQRITTIALAFMRDMASTPELVGMLCTRFNFQSQGFVRSSAAPKPGDHGGERRLYVMLIVTMIRTASKSFRKADTLRQIFGTTGLVSNAVKYLHRDSVDTILDMVDCIRECVVDSNAIQLPLLASFFNSFILEHLVGLHAIDTVRKPVNALLRALLARLSRCENIAEQHATKHDSGAPAASNLVLRLLPRLKANESMEQRGLVLNGLRAFPALWPEYIRHMKFSFDPRVSFRWLGNMSLFNEVLDTIAETLSQQSTFSLDAHQFACILPSSLTQSSLTRGLQHASDLVRYTTIISLDAIMECFLRFRDAAFVRTLPPVRWEFDMKWGRELSTLLPSLSVVMRLKRAWDPNGTVSGCKDKDLMYARYLHLLKRYQECIPGVLAENRVDIWKLLSAMVDNACVKSTPLCQSIIVDLIVASSAADSRIWLAKNYDIPHWHTHAPTISSNLGCLLLLYVQSRQKRLSYAASRLYSYIVNAFRTSGIFFGNPLESCVWLQHLTVDAIPYVCIVFAAANTQRSRATNDTDDADATNNIDSVLLRHACRLLSSGDVNNADMRSHVMVFLEYLYRVVATMSATLIHTDQHDSFIAAVRANTHSGWFMWHEGWCRFNSVDEPPLVMENESLNAQRREFAKVSSSIKRMNTRVHQAIATHGGEFVMQSLIGIDDGAVSCFELGAIDEWTQSWSFEFAWAQFARMRNEPNASATTTVDAITQVICESWQRSVMTMGYGDNAAVAPCNLTMELCIKCILNEMTAAAAAATAATATSSQWKVNVCCEVIEYIATAIEDSSLSLLARVSLLKQLVMHFVGVDFEFMKTHPRSIAAAVFVTRKCSAVCTDLNDMPSVQKFLRGCIDECHAADHTALSSSWCLVVFHELWHVVSPRIREQLCARVLSPHLTTATDILEYLPLMQSVFKHCAEEIRTADTYTSMITQFFVAYEAMNDDRKYRRNVGDALLWEIVSVLVPLDGPSVDPNLFISDTITQRMLNDSDEFTSINGDIMKRLTTQSNRIRHVFCEWLTTIPSPSAVPSHTVSSVWACAASLTTDDVTNERNVVALMTICEHHIIASSDTRKAAILAYRRLINTISSSGGIAVDMSGSAIRKTLRHLYKTVSPQVDTIDWPLWALLLEAGEVYAKPKKLRKYRVDFVSRSLSWLISGVSSESMRYFVAVWCVRVLKALLWASSESTPLYGDSNNDILQIIASCDGFIRHIVQTPMAPAHAVFIDLARLLYNCQYRLRLDDNTNTADDDARTTDEWWWRAVFDTATIEACPQYTKLSYTVIGDHDNKPTPPNFMSAAEVFATILQRADMLSTVFSFVANDNDADEIVLLSDDIVLSYMEFTASLFASSAPPSLADHENLELLLRAAYNGTKRQRDLCVKTILQQYSEDWTHWSKKWGQAAIDELKSAFTDDDGGGCGSDDTVKRFLSQQQQQQEHWLFTNFDRRQFRLGPHGCYDGDLVIPLLRGYFSECDVDVRKFLNMGGLSAIIWYCTNPQYERRQHAYDVLTMLFEILEKIARRDEESYAGRGRANRVQRHEYSFRERPQVTLLLTCLKSSLSERFQRLPSIIASFVQHAIEVLLKPEHEVYNSLNRFLLARPQLDLDDVPMLYSQFNSSSSHYKRDRGWILQMILNGVRTLEDTSILERRHVIGILMNFCDSKLSDFYSRDLALQIIERVCTFPEYVVDLVEKQALLSWLTSQLVVAMVSIPSSAAAAAATTANTAAVNGAPTTVSKLRLQSSKRGGYQVRLVRLLVRAIEVYTSTAALQPALLIGIINRLTNYASQISQRRHVLHNVMNAVIIALGRLLELLPAWQPATPLSCAHQHWAHELHLSYRDLSRVILWQTTTRPSDDAGAANANNDATADIITRLIACNAPQAGSVWQPKLVDCVKYCAHRMTTVSNEETSTIAAWLHSTLIHQPQLAPTLANSDDGDDDDIVRVLSALLCACNHHRSDAATARHLHACIVVLLIQSHESDTQWASVLRELHPSKYQMIQEGAWDLCTSDDHRIHRIAEDDDEDDDDDVDMVDA